MKRLVLAVICIFLCLGIQAVNTFPFRHIGIRDGLPDNYVKNVFGPTLFIVDSFQVIKTDMGTI